MNSKLERQSRIQRLQHELEMQYIDAIAIAPIPNMRYLLGFAPKYDERFCSLLVTQSDFRLVVPQVNADQAVAHTGAPSLTTPGKQNQAFGSTSEVGETSASLNMPSHGDGWRGAGNWIVRI